MRRQASRQKCLLNPISREKIKIATRKNSKKYRTELTDAYAAMKLAQKFNCRSADIYKIPGLIEVYRAKVLIERELKKKHGTNINKKKDRRFERSAV
jgi:hypothetical protein